MAKKIIITGSTGMVGEGVLHVCLQNPSVEKILIINRKPTGILHPKLTEIIHLDFYNISPIENRLSGYDTCFFCLGISSIGMKEDDYFKVTHTLTLHIAESLHKQNPNMTFCYVSGAGTDSSEKGKSMWARIKGKTENDLVKIFQQHAYAFRPGFIKPIKGLSHIHKFYAFINWIYPIGRMIYPNGFNTLEEIGKAMIEIALKDDDKKIIDGKDISRLAKLNDTYTP
jgi:hypothetical protein